MSEETRPFRVLGLQQIAIGGLERAKLRHLWCELLGVEQQGSYESAAENVLEDILRVGPASAPVEIDLMQPLDAARAPRVHEPALNHIGLWVDDLPAAFAWLEARGVRFAPGGIRPGAAGHDVCFIHPKPSADKPESGQGVLIELVQAPADVVTVLSQR
jgi:lactoylglutathione lyase